MQQLKQMTVLILVFVEVGLIQKVIVTEASWGDVLILVFVEVGLIPITPILVERPPTGLNPCFRGSWFDTIRAKSGVLPMERLS